MTRIFLIGFMAAGKTTLGRALAHKLGLQFIDLDLYIESRYHMSVSQLFAERGEDAFRRIERNLLHEVAEIENAVIATGGGTPCHFDNIDYMLQKEGTVVYLKASPEVIQNRLTIARIQRPLVAGKSSEELQTYIRQTLASRSPYYERAHRIFQADHLEDISQVNESVGIFIREILPDTVL